MKRLSLIEIVVPASAAFSSIAPPRPLFAWFMKKTVLVTVMLPIEPIAPPFRASFSVKPPGFGSSQLLASSSE